MVSLKAGDRVNCRVKSGSIVSAYNDYDEIRTFEIVATDGEGYYVFVPWYLPITGGTLLDASRARRLNIASRFIGERICYISAGQIARIAYQMDGRKCDRCGEFYMMAEPNQPDGSFLCWACKNNPYR